MKILSIDIGVKNSAFYIEEFDPDQLTFQNLYLQGKRVFWKLVNFTIPSDDIFMNIVYFLDANRKSWDSCNGIIIEQQMKTNPTAQQLEHFISAYFKIIYGSFKFVSNIPATRKTQVLGAPPKMDKRARKKWAVSEAHKIFDTRNDLEALKILYSGKSDDLADSCVQLKAFQKLVFLERKVP